MWSLHAVPELMWVFSIYTGIFPLFKIMHTTHDPKQDVVAKESDKKYHQQNVMYVTVLNHYFLY